MLPLVSIDAELSTRSVRPSELSLGLLDRGGELSLPDERRCVAGGLSDCFSALYEGQTHIARCLGCGRWTGSPPPLSDRSLYGRAVCVSMSVYGCAVGGRRWQTGAICSSVTGLLLTDVTAAALDRDELPDLAPIQDRSWSEPAPYIKSRAEDSFVL